MLNYKWNALYFLLSHHVPPSVRSIIVVCQRGATNCSETCWGRLLFCGSWRIAFIKTQLQPPSGAVNRGVLRGAGVEEGRSRALPRHVPKPLQPCSCLAPVTDHRGGRAPSTHLCPTRRDADDHWPPSSSMHTRRGTEAVMLWGRDGCFIMKGTGLMFPAEEQDERNSHCPWKLHRQTLQWGAVVAETLLCFGTWGEGEGWNRLAAAHLGDRKKESRA